LVASVSNDDRHLTISFGRGVEIETVHLAFQRFRANSSRWFLPRAEDHGSLAVSRSFLGTSISISATRLDGLRVLGALAGLLVSYGIAPHPIGPGLLQFLLHGKDVNALTSDFVREWYPQLHRTLRKWLDLNPSDDRLDEFQEHFASYHENEV